MYALTDAEVIGALERAEARGVEVRVILDPNQIGNQDHVDRLTEQGAEVKWFPVKKPGYRTGYRTGYQGDTLHRKHE